MAKTTPQQEIIEAQTHIIQELEADLESTKKQLKEKTSSTDTWYKQTQDLKSELEQVHVLLDILPQAPDRKSAPGEWGSTTTYTLMTRLAGWLANRTPTKD